MPARISSGNVREPSAPSSSAEGPRSPGALPSSRRAGAPGAEPGPVNRPRAVGQVRAQIGPGTAGDAWLNPESRLRVVGRAEEVDHDGRPGADDPPVVTGRQRRQ